MRGPHPSSVMPGRHRLVASPGSMPLGPWLWTPGAPPHGAPE